MYHTALCNVLCPTFGFQFSNIICLFFYYLVIHVYQYVSFRHSFLESEDGTEHSFLAKLFSKLVKHEQCFHIRLWSRIFSHELDSFLTVHLFDIWEN